MAEVNLKAEIKNISQSLQASLSSLSQSLNAEISTGIIYAISPTAKIQKLPNGDYRITITDKNGTTTTTVSDGQNGTNGQDGYTPVRGTDYWTASDIATIEAYIDSKTTGLLTSNYQEVHHGQNE